MAGLSPERFSSLIKGAATVTATSDLTDLLLATAETARDTTGARYAALGVIGDHATLVEFLHVGLEPGTAEKIGHLPVGKGVLGTLIHSANTIRLDRLQDHPDSTGFPPNHPPMETFLGVPVQVGERVFGNLYLTEKPGGFSEEDEDVVEALAVIAGSAVANSRIQRRLRQLALVDDRERIARELHDAIIQDIFAVGLLLQAFALRLEDDRERREIEGAIARLDDAITSMRRFIFDLRRPVDPGRNLLAELTRIVRQLAHPYGVEVGVTVAEDVADQSIPLPERLIDDASQLVREATSNALRHSGSSDVEVRVDRGPESLVIIVTDAGHGFEPATFAEGMGLQNLRSRAEKAGGQATIGSRPGEGTTVRAVLPI